MPFLILTKDGRALAVHTEVGDDECARVVVQEGEHHYQPTPLEPVDED